MFISLHFVQCLLDIEIWDDADRQINHLKFADKASFAEVTPRGLVFLDCIRTGLLPNTTKQLGTKTHPQSRTKSTVVAAPSISTPADRSITNIYHRQITQDSALMPISIHAYIHPNPFQPLISSYPFSPSAAATAGPYSHPQHYTD